MGLVEDTRRLWKSSFYTACARWPYTWVCFWTFWVTGRCIGRQKLQSRLYFKSSMRDIGKSFQLAITAPRLDLIGYGTTTAQSWSEIERLEVFMAQVDETWLWVKIWIGIYSSCGNTAYFAWPWRLRRGERVASADTWRNPIVLSLRLRLRLTYLDRIVERSIGYLLTLRSCLGKVQTILKERKENRQINLRPEKLAGGAVSTGSWMHGSSDMIFWIFAGSSFQKITARGRKLVSEGKNFSENCKRNFLGLMGE